MSSVIPRDFFVCDFEEDILNRNIESVISLENKASCLILKHKVVTP